MLRFGYEGGKKQSEFWGNARARLVVVARCMAWACPERRRKRERKRRSGEREEMASLPQCGFTGRGCFLASFFFACGPAARAWEMKTQSGLGWARVYLTAGNRLDRSNRPYHRGSVGVTDRFLIKSNLLN
jgi:hypothetical protein